MADQGRPDQRPGDLVAIHYQKRCRGGFSPGIKYISMSRFKRYGYLEWYLLEKFDDRDGADFLDITYTKYSDPYNDVNNIERRLGSEPWKDFAATVYHILIRRV